MKLLRPHTLVELEDDLLLVFRPQGHTAATHAHDYTQAIRVLRGRLAVRIGTLDHMLTAEDPPLHITFGTTHETHAVEPTWVVVERIG